MIWFMVSIDQRSRSLFGNGSLCCDCKQFECLFLDQVFASSSSPRGSTMMFGIMFFAAAQKK